MVIFHKLLGDQAILPGKGEISLGCWVGAGGFLSAPDQRAKQRAGRRRQDLLGATRRSFRRSTHPACPTHAEPKIAPTAYLDSRDNASDEDQCEVVGRTAPQVRLLYLLQAADPERLPLQERQDPIHSGYDPLFKKVGLDADR